MALSIAEFSSRTVNGLSFAAMPPLAEQTVAIGGGSVQSNAFSASTQVLRLQNKEACSIAIGPNPTATTSTLRMPAESVEYFVVNPGEKIAVIANA